ncbi:MAG: GtrA family protein [Desulforhopalus sp.]
MLKQFLCFTGVGAVGTVAHYLVLVCFVEVLSIDPVAGSISGFIVGAVVNYTLNYYLTFKSTARHKDTGPKFFFVALIGFFINSLVMYTLVNMLGVHYVFSQVISTGLVLFWNFFVSRIWVFNHGKIKENS